MQITLNVLEDIVQRLYQPTNEHAVWLLTCGPSEPPKGAGILFSTAADVAAQILTAKHNTLTCHWGLSSYGFSPGQPTVIKALRSELQTNRRFFVAMDIDNADQDPSMTGTRLIGTVKNLPVKPWLIADTTNGVHFYYLFDRDVNDISISLHHILTDMYISAGIGVDPGTRYPRATLRAFGGVGKDGTMQVGQKAGELDPQQVYDPEALAAAFDRELVPNANMQSEGVTLDPVDLSAPWQFYMHPQADREHVLTHCAAYRQFVEDSADSWSRGQRGNYHDVRMYCSVEAHIFEKDRTDYETVYYRQLHAQATLERWPGSTPDYALPKACDGYTTPCMGCDHWSPHYTSECVNCPAYGKGTNPIEHASEQQLMVEQHELAAKIHFEQNAIPAVTAETPQATQSLAEMVMIYQQYITSLPDGYQISKDNILFRKVEAQGDADERFIRVACPAFVISGVVLEQGSNVKQDNVAQYILRATPAPNNPNYVVEKRMPVSAFASIPEFKKMSVKYGMLEVDGREFNRYVKACIDSPKCTVYRQAANCGWSPDFYSFFLPSVKLQAEAGAVIRHPLLDSLANEEDVSAIVPTRGTTPDYIAKVLLPLASDPNLMRHYVLVLASLATPLRQLAGLTESGPLVCLCGKGTLGKSVALRAAHTVWQEFKNFSMTARDTSNGQFSMLERMQNLPCTLDEISNIEDDTLVELVYQATVGQTKNALNPNQTFRRVAKWNNTLLATSNPSLHTKMSKNRNYNAAVSDRVMEIPIYEVRTPDLKRVIDGIRDHTKYNYGSLGIDFLSYVITNRQYLLDSFVHIGQHHYFIQGSRFLQTTCELVLVVSDMLATMGLLDNRAHRDELIRCLQTICQENNFSTQKTVNTGLPVMEDIMQALDSQSYPRHLEDFKEILGHTMPGEPVMRPNVHCWKGDRGYAVTSAAVSNLIRDVAAKRNGRLLNEAEFLEHVRGLYRELGVDFDFVDRKRLRVPRVKNAPNDTKTTGSEAVMSQFRCLIFPIPPKPGVTTDVEPQPESAEAT